MLPAEARRIFSWSAVLVIWPDTTYYHFRALLRFLQVWVSLLTSFYASFANSSVLENWQDDSKQLPHPFVLGLILRFLSDVSPEICIQLRLNADLICNTKMWTVQITFCLLKKENHCRGIYEQFQSFKLSHIKYVSKIHMYFGTCQRTLLNLYVFLCFVNLELCN